LAALANGRWPDRLGRRARRLRGTGKPDHVRRVIETAFKCNALASGTELAAKLFTVTGFRDIES